MPEKSGKRVFKLTKNKIIAIALLSVAVAALVTVIVLFSVFAAKRARFTVTFDANGGYFENEQTTYAIHGIKKGSLISDPVHPTRDGYGMVGWTFEPDGEVRWDFEKDKVTKDTNLYAEWSNQTFFLELEYGENGKVDMTAQAYHIAGTAVTVKALPYPGYKLESWKIKGEDKVISTSAEYTFYMPERRITLRAEFCPADEMKNLEFKSTESSCEITKVDKSVTNLVVPDYVTTINDEAMPYDNKLTTLVIGKGIKYIAVNTFKDCTNLKRLHIGENVLKIYSGAFFGCTALETVTMSASVNEICYQAFYGCESLTSFVVSDGVKEIGPQAFGACSSLKTITLSRSLIKMGRNVFVGCTALKEVKFTDGYDWYSVADLGDDKTSGIKVDDLKNAKKAADILRSDKYANSFWKSLKAFSPDL